MEYKMLGGTDEKISVIGLGFWQAGSHSWNGTSFLKEIKEGLQHALALGFNFFDTAEVYGAGRSELILGEVIGNNDNVLVATKTPGFRTTVEDIVKSAMNSRRRLKRDSIDLLQYHWPPPHYADLCRIMKGMERTIEMGITRYIGVSNFNKNLTEKARECLKKHDIVSNQVQYSLGYRSIEQELKNYLYRENITIIAWSPLAKGGLAGKRRTETIAQKNDKVFKNVIKDNNLQIILEKIARENNTTKTSVALRWLIEKDSIPIPGYRRKERITQYYDAIKTRLSQEHIKRLDQATQKYIYTYGDYNPFNKVRLVPSTIQKFIYHILGGF